MRQLTKQVTDRKNYTDFTASICVPFFVRSSFKAEAS